VAKFYLSFVDPDLPEGRRFMGACVVDVPKVDDQRLQTALAIKQAWRLNINPGGDVLMLDATEVPDDRVGKLWRTREEIAEALGGAVLTLDELRQRRGGTDADR
jgi:hypothetical protein